MARVYIGSISFKIREDQLRETFGDYGPIKSVKMSFDASTGQHKGYAFLEYEIPEGALLAQEAMNGLMMGGRNIKIVLVQLGRPQAQPIIDMIMTEARKYHRIYVASVHEDLNENDLRTVFSSFGNIIKCQLAKSASGKHRGFGYIEFETTLAAAKAITGMNLFDFGGKLLHVGECITPPEALSYVIPNTVLDPAPDPFFELQSPFGMNCRLSRAFWLRSDDTFHVKHSYMIGFPGLKYTVSFRRNGSNVQIFLNVIPVNACYRHFTVRASGYFNLLNHSLVNFDGVFDDTTDSKLLCVIPLVTWLNLFSPDCIIFILEGVFAIEKLYERVVQFDVDPNINDINDDEESKDVKLMCGNDSVKVHTEVLHCYSHLFVRSLRDINRDGSDISPFEYLIQDFSYDAVSYVIEILYGEAKLCMPVAEAILCEKFASVYELDDFSEMVTKTVVLTPYNIVSSLIVSKVMKSRKFFVFCTAYLKWLCTYNIMIRNFHILSTDIREEFNNGETKHPKNRRVIL
uniref:Uncharacterized protein n=1 Tax=Panagrolaimus davidi TaxID=227884 RepID=A0A914Q4H4_9BILA